MPLLPIPEPRTDNERLLNSVLALDHMYNPTYLALKAYQLGDSVISIEDSNGETHIFFDLSKWDYEEPEIWPGYKRSDLGIGILPSTGSPPNVASPSQTLEFARGQLTTTSAAQWFETPKEFDTSQ